jgi:hypothetical protein
VGDSGGELFFFPGFEAALEREEFAACEMFFYKPYGFCAAPAGSAIKDYRLITIN